MNIETGNRLLSYRKKYGYSQEELAEKIGVSRQAVSKWERAEASPDTDNLILLAKIYGVTLDELLTGTAEEQQPKKDKISFKNGIHIKAKNGDVVDIGFNGIHVNDKKGTKVDIDGNGVSVVDSDGRQRVTTDENGHIFVNGRVDPQRRKKFKAWRKFPFPILVVILFLLWGFLFNGWAVSWILFLFIPIYYSLIDALEKKNLFHFVYPVVTVIIFLFCGLTMSIWHPTWIIFLTIPLYYWVCSFFKLGHDDEEDKT